MRKFFILLIAAAALLCLSACAGNTPSPSPSLSAAPSPSLEPSATPQPVAETVAAFSADPAAFIENAIAELPGMSAMLSDEALSARPDKITSFMYNNLNITVDADNSFVFGGTSSYNIYMTPSNPQAALDSFAETVSAHLGITYADQTSSYSVDGKQIEETYKAGSGGGYKYSSLTCNGNQAASGNMQLSLEYGAQNAAFTKLVQDSFSRLSVSLPSQLDGYETNSGVSFGYNQYAQNIHGGEPKPQGGVSASCWCESDGDAQSIIAQLESSGFVSDNSEYYKYSGYLPLEDDIFDFAAAELYYPPAQGSFSQAVFILYYKNA